MAFDAGSIVASLDLDRDPFQRKLEQAKRDAKKFADSKYSPKVDADTTAVTAKVIDIRDRLDRLSNTRVTPKLTVDNAAGLVKLVDFQERLDRIRGKVAQARVDADTETVRAKLDALDIQLRKVGTITSKPKVTLQGVERANIEVDALELKLRALGATTARPRVTGGGGGGFLGSQGGLFGKGGFFRPKGALLNAGIFLGPTALPLAAGAAGLGASFLTPAVAGSLGLGLFGAASKSAVTRVDAVQKKLDALDKKIAQTPATTTTTTKAASPAQIQAAQMRLDAAQARLASQEARGRSTTSAQASVVSAQASLTALQGRGGSTTTANKTYENLVKQRNALLKQLTPAERDAAEGIDKLDKGWVAFQRAIEPETFKLVASGTDIATKGLHLMLPATKAVGDTLDTLAGQADHALNEPFWKDFFGRFLAQEAPRAVDTLGKVLGHVGSGFAHLTEDFAPLGHDLENDLVRWSGIFDKWTQGSGPGKFVATVEHDGPIAAQALKGLVSGLDGLAQGLEPIGRIELEALTPVLDFIGAVGKQHPEFITALGAAYLGVAGGLKAIAAVKGLAGIVGVVTGLGRGGKPSVGTGSGGILGRLGAQGSTPANPLYVFVVDKAPSHGPNLPPILPKLLPKLRLPLTLAGAYLATQGGDEAPDQALGLGGASPVTKAVALALRAYSMHNDVTKLPKVDQQLLGAAVSTNNAGQTHVNVQAATEFLKQYDPKTLDALAQKYPQVAAAIQQANKQVSVLNQYLVTNTGLATANARAVDAQRAALQRELSTLSSLPTYLKDAQAAATSGGFVIGKDLKHGILLGLQQPQGTVDLVNVTSAGGKTHVQSVKASLAGGGSVLGGSTYLVGEQGPELFVPSASGTIVPSGKTKRIGNAIGSELAQAVLAGFTGYQADLLKAFSQSTQVTLDKLGLQLNTAATKYRTDLQGRADLKSSIAGTLFGAADIGNAVTSNTGGASLTGFLGGQLATDERLEALVTAARRRGLDPGLIQQAVNAGGQQGIALLTQALSGGAAGVKTLNAQEKALGAVTQAIGGSVSTGVFAPTLAKDQRNLDHIAAAIEHFVGQRLRLDRADMQQFARDIAREFAKVFPTLNLKELDKALGIKISGGG